VVPLVAKVWGDGGGGECVGDGGSGEVRCSYSSSCYLILCGTYRAMGVMARLGGGNI
jgi:hypothetical protein